MARSRSNAWAASMLICSAPIHLRKTTTAPKVIHNSFGGRVAAQSFDKQGRNQQVGGQTIVSLDRPLIGFHRSEQCCDEGSRVGAVEGVGDFHRERPYSSDQLGQMQFC